MFQAEDAFRPAPYLRNGNVQTILVIHTYGGHNGFIDGFFLKSWYEQKLADTFDEIVMAS